MSCSACQLDSAGGFSPEAAAYARNKAGARSRRDEPVDLSANEAARDKAAAVAYVAAKAGAGSLTKQVDAATPLQPSDTTPSSGAPLASTPAQPGSNPPPATAPGLVYIALRGDPWEDPVVWLAGASAFIAAVNLVLHLARRA